MNTIDVPLTAARGRMPAHTGGDAVTDPTATDDYRGLLRAVLEDPAADLPRLVLADYLEETADKPHHHEYAQFVRLQVELAGMSLENLGTAHRKLADVMAGRTSPAIVLDVAFPGRRGLIDRERELLLANVMSWLPRLPNGRDTFEAILSPRWTFAGTPAAPGSLAGSSPPSR